mmetsp:Transcript_23948/g.31161  ORF Transcript_23948/g.31161 Transcript_23948/m.31161 type:complete len:176 (+) Transcript_23948:629-1156(+)
MNVISLKHIGEYGVPPQKDIWFKQCLIYIISLLINKIIVCLIFISIENQLNQFADWLFKPLQTSNGNLELIVVMILCPWFLTSIQFLLFDYMLKAQPTSTSDNDLFLLNNERLDYSKYNNELNRKQIEEEQRTKRSYFSIDFVSNLPSLPFSSSKGINDQELPHNPYVNMDSDAI